MKVIEYPRVYNEVMSIFAKNNIVCESCGAKFVLELGDKIRMAKQSLFEEWGWEGIRDNDYWEDIDFENFNPKGRTAPCGDVYVYGFDSCNELIEDQLFLTKHLSDYRAVCLKSQLTHYNITIECPVCGNEECHNMYFVPSCMGLSNDMGDDEVYVEHIFTKKYQTSDGKNFTFAIGVGYESGSYKLSQEDVKTLESIGYAECEDKNEFSRHMAVLSEYDYFVDSEA